MTPPPALEGFPDPATPEGAALAAFFLGPDARASLTWLGGNCPVQAEGTIDGHPFYFRARGQRWTMEVGEGAKPWTFEAAYGQGPYDAGHMPFEEAYGFVAESLKLWDQSGTTS